MATPIHFWSEHRLIRRAGEEPARTPDAAPRPEATDTARPLRQPRRPAYQPDAERDDRAADVAGADALLDDAESPDYGKQLAGKRDTLLHFGNAAKVSATEVTATKELVKDILGWTGDQRAIGITLDVRVSNDQRSARILVLDEKTDRQIGFLDATFDKNEVQVFETARDIDLVALNRHVKTLNTYTTTATDEEVDALKETIKDVLRWRGEARDTPLYCRVKSAKDASAYTIEVENKTTREPITTITLTRDTGARRFTEGAIQKLPKQPAK